MKELEFSKETIEELRRHWDSISMLVRSLDQQVPMDWIIKAFKEWSKLQYDLEPLALVEDHHLVRFQSEEDCIMILTGGPG